jgi:hypothetical protein
MIEILAIAVAVASLIVNAFQYFWGRQQNKELEHTSDKFSTLVDNYIELRGKFFDLKNKEVKKPIKRTPPQKKVGPGRPLGSKNKK